MLSVMGAIAQFERELIRERQREGIALAKLRGAYRGRKRSLTADQVKEVKERLNAGEKKAAIAKSLGVSRSTLYEAIKQTVTKELRT